MQNLLDTILDAERQAKSRVAEAARISDATKAKAEADAASIISKAKEEAAAEAKEIVDKARRQIQDLMDESRHAMEKDAKDLYLALDPQAHALAETVAGLAMATVLER